MKHAKRIFSAATLFILLSFAPSLQADDTPPCFREIENTFFNSYFVQQAFAMHQLTIPQGQWDLILSSLKQKVPSIPQRVSQAASRLDPNPLENYSQKDAVQLLLSVLYDVFSETMHENYISNESTIQDMFHYIRSKQTSKLKSCFGDNLPPEVYK